MDNNHFKSFRFEAWSDGRSNMCCIRADTEKSYIWFVMMEKELEEFAQSRFQSTFVDGYHRMDSYGDNVFFYDFECPMVPEGKKTISYISLYLPVFARKILLRAAKRAWKLHREHKMEEKFIFHISIDKLNKWAKNYRPGSGQVKINMRSNETQNLFDSYQNQPSFHDMVERLQVIGKNGTSAYWEEGVVDLSKDLDGFFFVIRNPRGRETMHGGLVNHKPNSNEGDWSLHT